MIGERAESLWDNGKEVRVGGKLYLGTRAFFVFLFLTRAPFFKFKVRAVV